MHHLSAAYSYNQLYRILTLHANAYCKQLLEICPEMHAVMKIVKILQNHQIC